jgi:hypothetical protein
VFAAAAQTRRQRAKAHRQFLLGAGGDVFRLLAYPHPPHQRLHMPAADLAPLQSQQAAQHTRTGEGKLQVEAVKDEMVTRLSNRLVGHPSAKDWHDPVKHIQFRMEQMDRYHFCSMWSRPTICFFQIQGMSKTSCHFRPDKRSSLPYRITWRCCSAAVACHLAGVADRCPPKACVKAFRAEGILKRLKIQGLARPVSITSHRREIHVSTA